MSPIDKQLIDEIQSNLDILAKRLALLNAIEQLIIRQKIDD